MIHYIYLVVAYEWEDVQIEKAYLSEKAAYQKANMLNTVNHLGLSWDVEEIEVGD